MAKRRRMLPSATHWSELGVWAPQGEGLLWGRPARGRADPSATLPFVFLRGRLEPELVSYLLRDSSVRSLVRAGVEELCPEAYRGHKARCFHAVETSEPEVMMVGFEHDGPHPP
ncbi:unnamed protein product, partial [Effrenium voratum]